MATYEVIKTVGKKKLLATNSLNEAIGSILNVFAEYVLADEHEPIIELDKNDHLVWVGNVSDLPLLVEWYKNNKNK